MEQNSLIVFLGIFREKPFGNRGFLSLRSAQSSTKTKKFPVIFPASSELDLENGFAWLRPPPPSLAEPCIFPSGSSRPFVPGFPLSVTAPFGLCGRPLSLAPISAALSPHPKIPFPGGQGSARLRFGFIAAKARRRWQRRCFWACAIVADSTQALRTADSIPPEHRAVARC
jgi:hypothetical protein